MTHITIDKIVATSIITLSFARMVFYFTSNVVSPSAFIYVGKDKVESTALAYLYPAMKLTEVETRS